MNSKHYEISALKVKPFDKLRANGINQIAHKSYGDYAGLKIYSLSLEKTSLKATGISITLPCI